MKQEDGDVVGRLLKLFLDESGECKEAGEANAVERYSFLDKRDNVDIFN